MKLSEAKKIAAKIEHLQDALNREMHDAVQAGMVVDIDTDQWNVVGKQFQKLDISVKIRPDDVEVDADGI